MARSHHDQTITLQLNEQEIESIISLIESDHREISQGEENALNRVLSALHTYTEL